MAGHLFASFTMLRGSSAAYAARLSPGRVDEVCSGGTVPTGKLAEALKMPFVNVPLVNGDNNQHSFDENLRLGHYLNGVKASVGLMSAAY